MPRIRINTVQLYLHTITIVAVLAVCISSIHCHSFFPSFTLTPIVSHQPLPLVRNYYRPLNLFNPSYDYDFGGNFYQPEILPFFPDHKPTNETTEKPLEVTTSSGSDDKTPDELSTVKPDNNDTFTPSFDDIFKKTIISPQFGFVPREPVFISNTPVFPQIEKVVIPPSSNYNFLVNHLHRINDAYGLPGFRPFYYDKFLRELKESNCTESSKPCGDDLTPQNSEDDMTKTIEDKKTADIINVINKIYKPDPNIVVFNTKDTPFLKASEEVTTDEELDIRNGKAVDKKSQKDPFSHVYTDIMFLNKSFLSTVAPYLHR